MLDDPMRTTETPEMDDAAANLTESDEMGELGSEGDQKEKAIQYFKGRLGQEVAERRKLEAKLAEFEGRLNEQRQIFTQGQPKEEERQTDPYALSEDEMEEIRNDPTLLIERQKRRDEAMLETLQTQLVNLLTAQGRQDEQRFGALASKVRELDPEIAAWKPVVEKLRAKEALKDLPEETLITIAQEMGMKPAYEYRGGLGDGQRPRQSQSKATESEKAEARQMFLAMTGDAEKVKKLMKRKFGEE